MTPRARSFQYEFIGLDFRSSCPFFCSVLPLFVFFFWPYQFVLSSSVLSCQCIFHLFSYVIGMLSYMFLLQSCPCPIVLCSIMSLCLSYFPLLCRVNLFAVQSNSSDLPRLCAYFILYSESFLCVCFIVFCSIVSLCSHYLLLLYNVIFCLLLSHVSSCMSCHCVVLSCYCEFLMFFFIPSSLYLYVILFCYITLEVSPALICHVNVFILSYSMLSCHYIRLIYFCFTTSLHFSSSFANYKVTKHGKSWSSVSFLP